MYNFLNSFIFTYFTVKSTLLEIPVSTLLHYSLSDCKTVSRITYTVLVETLNPAQSNSLSEDGSFQS